MGRLIGIDLGTDFAVVAAFADGAPRVLENRESKPRTRCAVSVRARSGEREILVGDAAYDNHAMAPHDTILHVKHLVGRSIDDAIVREVASREQCEIVASGASPESGVSIVLGGERYSPVDILALIFSKLKADAEYCLGEEVTHAVIAVPAYFTGPEDSAHRPTQRRAVREAAERAGLGVARQLSRPLAAAIAYDEPISDVAPRVKTLVVLDFDTSECGVSVLVCDRRTYVPVSPTSHPWLGAEDLDQSFLEMMAGQCCQKYGLKFEHLGPRFMALAKAECRSASERLRECSSTEVGVFAVASDEDEGPLDIAIEITREEFDTCIEPLVDESMSLVDRALVAAGLSYGEVDHVITVGEATEVPLVRRKLEERFGVEKLLRTIDPRYCVAFGAAKGVNGDAGGEYVVCHECGGLNESEVGRCSHCGTTLWRPTTPEDSPSDVLSVSIAPFDYGLQTRGDALDVVVRAKDPVPTLEPKAVVVRTVHFDQRIVTVAIWGGLGLEAEPSRAEAMGQIVVVLPSGLPARSEVVLSLGLDGDGIFDPSAALGDGTRLAPWIGRPGEKEELVLQEVLELENSIARLEASGESITGETARRWEIVLDQLRKLRIAEVERSIAGLRELL
jgi:molecular chaperone DnaK